MAHLLKHTKAACGHMFAHYDRSCENIGNESIDPERTHLNYNLATHQLLPQGEFVRQRCSEVKCQNRKDVNVMCSWVVTLPKDFPEHETGKFFEETYAFLSARYGKENVVSAWVHMDETTPHMHFAFVPVVHDREKGCDKVSAKLCTNRSDLQRFHGDLSRHLEAALGHEVGILNEATRDGNKAIEELKRGTAQERLEHLIDEYLELEAIIKAEKAKLERFKDTAIEKAAKAEKALTRDLGRLEKVRQEITKLRQHVKKSRKRVTVSKEEYREFEQNREKYRDAYTNAMKDAAAMELEWLKQLEAAGTEREQHRRLNKELTEKTAACKALESELQRKISSVQEVERLNVMQINERALELADKKSKCKSEFIKQQGLENEYLKFEKQLLPPSVVLQHKPQER